MRRRFDPFDKRAMLFSIALHGGLLALAWLSTFHQPPQFEFVTYQIELVSPPAAVQAEQRTPPRQQLVVERPQPQQTRPEPQRPAPEPPPTRPEPRPEPPRQEPQPQPQPQRQPEPQTQRQPDPPEPDPAPAPAASPDAPPEKPPEESGEGINVRLEGLRRDYPEYYANIIRQIDRCFRWQGAGNPQTTVTFAIRRDGTVRDLAFVTRSGNTSFDFAAMGAVECAGQGRFGPLPEELPYESLPVRFDFTPSGR